jgi:hypothetical protein
MTRAQLLELWAQRSQELARYAAHVDGARLLGQCIGEVEQLFRQEESESLTLREAASLSGYSVDHLARLIRAGSLLNVGRPYRPRVRRGDLPRKALREPPETGLVSITSKGQIARSVVNSHRGRHDG